MVLVCSTCLGYDPYHFFVDARAAIGTATEGLNSAAESVNWICSDAMKTIASNNDGYIWLLVNDGGHHF